MACARHALRLPHTACDCTPHRQAPSVSPACPPSSPYVRELPSIPFYPTLHILSYPQPHPHPIQPFTSIQPSTSYHNLSHTAALARGSGAGPNARARRCSCCSSAACCPEAAHRPRRLRRRQRRAPASRARRTPRRPGVACPTAWPKCEDDRPLRRSGACAQSLTAAFDHVQVRGSWPVRGARTN